MMLLSLTLSDLYLYPNALHFHGVDAFYTVAFLSRSLFDEFSVRW